MFESDIVQPAAGPPEKSFRCDSEIQASAEPQLSNGEGSRRAESLVEPCRSDEDARRFVPTVDVMVDIALIEGYRSGTVPSQRSGFQDPVDRGFIHGAASFYPDLTEEIIFQYPHEIVPGRFDT